MDPVNEAFDLGDWHVDVGGNRLLRDGEVRPLRHKAMALLVLLARHAGQTVPRETLVQQVWDGNAYVADKAINTAVWAIRQALGDDPEAPRYVQTIAKKGYRLVAPVTWSAAAPAPDVTPAPAPPVAAQATPVAATAPRRRFAPAGWLLAAAALALGAEGWWARGSAPRAAAVLQATPLTQLPGLEYVGRLSPDGRWVAFGWWQGRGGGRLHVRAVDRPDETPRELAAGSGDVEGLAWSPDSRTLAFTASDGPGRCTLWRVDLAGGSPRALARCAPLFTPGVDWSPDGRQIVFSGDADGAGGLFAVAPDGSGLRRLTTAPPLAVADHQPVWSPDGRRLAFARQDPADGTRGLFERGDDGAVRALAPLRLYRLHGLAYSADGQDLVYSTTQQDRRMLMRWERRSGSAVPLGLEGSAPALASGGGFVYSLLRSHVSLARLAAGAAAPERVVTSVGSDREPHDHPAAPGAVFVSRRSGAPELWLAPRDGSPQRALTRLGGVVGAPAWAPTGDRIAFLGTCGPAGRYGVCRLDLASGAVQPLATDAADYGRPAWHPDGRSLWVTSDRGGRWQLWRLDAASGDATPMPTDAEPGRALAWADDGRALVYEPRRGGDLRWRPAAAGAERALGATPAGAERIDWRLGPAGLVVLERGTRERIERIDLASGRRETWADLALGTCPERARLAVGADGALWLEVADTATADLMLAR